MSGHLRPRLPAALILFTVAPVGRRSDLLVREVGRLRDAVAVMRLVCCFAPALAGTEKHGAGAGYWGGGLPSLPLAQNDRRRRRPRELTPGLVDPTPKFDMWWMAKLTEVCGLIW